MVEWVSPCVLKDKYYSRMELPVVNHPDYVAKINDDNKLKFVFTNKIEEND